MFNANTQKKINLDDLVYYRERTRNRVYATVISLFSRLVETRKLTKAELAFRLQKEPAQITRWLGGPSNWTLDTISDLLLAMGCELDTKFKFVNEIANTSQVHPLLIERHNVAFISDVTFRVASAAPPQATPVIPTANLLKNVM
jgi:hypothetical protein